ncbi:MAG TPA: FtsX-like permease family protein [Bacteroidota bacterium]|nr:FtsX-like permease family protein [Bacteroidota bacterium]
MIRFLLKGVLRDRSRSLFPFLTVLVGVVLTVLLHAWLTGVVSSLIKSTADFSTGHVRVMTRSYAKEAAQDPNDLALLGIDTLLAGLRRDYPDLLWTPRIKFGGLLDIPDERRETKAQAPIAGMGVDLFSPKSPEWKILNLQHSIVRGRLPERRGEILVGDELAKRLDILPGDTVTLISSTMYGSLSITNFVMAGTVRFGLVAMDRGMMLADVSDIQQALDMQNGAGEILGFFGDDLYHEERADAMTKAFNGHDGGSSGGTGLGSTEFAPVMGTLRTESGLSDYLDIVNVFSNVIVGIFVLAMSIVLWNAGLTGSLRRYGELGLRLAIGEDRTHVYLSLLAESLMIGTLGSAVGTAIGLGLAYFAQTHGIDIGAIMKESTMMLPDVVRAQITPFAFVIGFVPGLLATFLGTAISGIGIYKRHTSELFKELDT